VTFFSPCDHHTDLIDDTDYGEWVHNAILASLVLPAVGAAVVSFTPPTAVTITVLPVVDGPRECAHRRYRGKSRPAVSTLMCNNSSHLTPHHLSTHHLSPSSTFPLKCRRVNCRTPLHIATMTTSLPALFSLGGQKALITGGTRGIGAAMAMALAEAGADIVLIQRSKVDTKTQEAIKALGRECTIYVADLASQSNLVSVIPTILEEEKRIHILLNCGGIQRRHPAEKFPDEDWNDVIQVNLTSVFTLCRELGGHMLKQEPMDSMGRRGAVVNVASLLSFQGGITVPAYAASKGGVAQLTKALSNDWAGKGITVNAIAPGYIATEMNEALMKDEARASSILGRIPAARWGSPEDFKGAVVYLASRASGYVTGEILVSLWLRELLL
jgi:2-deoxy-D-gluconate 3-dehydrogenase